MAKYGVDYYGTVYYGNANAVEFSADPFLAKPQDYNDIHVTWASPTGDWDYIRLVRNSFGFPIVPDDGDLLFEDAVSTSRIDYEDHGQEPNNVGLKSGQAYYYTLFVRETSTLEWKRAGDAIGISVKDYGTTEMMYNSLPAILRAQVPYNSSLDQENIQLKNFLKLFALKNDLYKTQASNVLKRYDVSSLNGLLIPVFMAQFGMKYEPSLGLKQSRILLRNAGLLYKNKGSLTGLLEYLKAYSGYDNEVTVGKNLMLDYNNSSFEESVGDWTSSKATLEAYSISNTPYIAPYNEITSLSTYPNKQESVLKVTTTDSGTIILEPGVVQPIDYGVPVTTGLDYTFSFYSQAGSTARTVTSQIKWYDRFGNLLSTSSAGSGISNTSATWTRGFVTATAPTDAYFAAPIISIAGASATEVHYFDALQFEQSSSATDFQDARQLIINLKASRVNELTNPNFEPTFDGWNNTNSTIVFETALAGLPTSETSSELSAGAVETYATIAGDVKVYSDQINVLENNDYTFSVYCATAQVGVTHSLVPFIEWYDSTSTLISVDNGDTYTINGFFKRPYVTASAPTGAVTASVGATWVAANPADEVTFDAALFEKSSFLGTFFDGAFGIGTDSDRFWEGGVANAGRSHYYKNRGVVESRLISTLPNWLVYGTTFELRFAEE